MLEKVKTALGIVGEYQNATIQEYIDEVLAFCADAGVINPSVGLVTRGVADLWNYGAGDGKLSTYFIQRVTQLAY